jgi:hypothetical protein
MGRFIAIICFLFSSAAAASDYHLLAQTGSYSGALTLGLGYQKSYFTGEVMAGYVPEKLGGEDLYSASFKSIFHPNSCAPIIVRCTRVYGGVNVVLSLFDSDTFILQPSQYPAGYYPPNGVRAAIFAGLEFFTSGNYSFYAEISSLDLYLETWVRSDYKMSIESVTTYGIGYKINLREFYE